MNPKDFDGIYKWKFLVPIIYIMNWSLVIIGPLLIPYAYQIFCMTVIVYSLLKGLGLCLGTLVSLINLKKTIKKLKVRFLLYLAKRRKCGSPPRCIFSYNGNSKL